MNGTHGGGEENSERDQRRLLRVRRELERIQEVEEQEQQRRQEEEDPDQAQQQQFNILEFAENFFNDHEKSPSGTIVGTIKRSKTLEILGKIYSYGQFLVLPWRNKWSGPGG